jgi:hypothetical protein
MAFVESTTVQMVKDQEELSAYLTYRYACNFVQSIKIKSAISFLWVLVDGPLEFIWLLKEGNSLARYLLKRYCY